MPLDRTAFPGPEIDPEHFCPGSSASDLEEHTSEIVERRARSNLLGQGRGIFNVAQSYRSYFENNGISGFNFPSPSLAVYDVEAEHEPS
jgi:hypothetical protein